jgi:probable F420-dependent oxidoreductase
MRYAVSHTNFGSYADARHIARIARAAEDAGWDGLFVWDHLGWVEGIPSGDPWVLLTAAAMATERIAIGTAVTPVPRRRPHVLAHTVATLDRASAGRVIFGAGLGGVPREFEAFGEDPDPKHRAVMLDEGLEILSRLWSGERVTFRGRHHIVDDVALTPGPAHRIPIWIGGDAPPALRRAARWDGWATGGLADPPSVSLTLTPDELRTKVDAVRAHRDRADDFDVAFAGYGTGQDLSAWADAGVTWWLETIHDLRAPPDEMLRLVEAGPQT